MDKKKCNYKTLELDNIVLELSKIYNIEERKAFDVYKKINHKEFNKKFVEKIRKFLSKNKLVIIEGALTSKKLIDEVFKNYEFLFVYLYPSSIDRYCYRIKKRLESTKKEKVSNIIIKEQVKKMQLESKERLNKFINDGYKVNVIKV